MSFTTVSKTGTGNTSQSRLLLSPSTRRRVSHETHEERKDDDEPPNVEEIWKWTMTPAAVATCFARDVFDMKENLIGGTLGASLGIGTVTLTKGASSFCRSRFLLAGTRSLSQCAFGWVGSGLARS